MDQQFVCKFCFQNSKAAVESNSWPEAELQHISGDRISEYFKLIQLTRQLPCQFRFQNWKTTVKSNSRPTGVRLQSRRTCDSNASNWLNGSSSLSASFVCRIQNVSINLTAARLEAELQHTSGECVIAIFQIYLMDPTVSIPASFSKLKNQWLNSIIWTNTCMPQGWALCMTRRAAFKDADETI